MNAADAAERRLTRRVALDVAVDHLAHEVSEGGVGRAGVVVRVAVTAAATDAQ